jgi:hypothetical protein
MYDPESLDEQALQETWTACDAGFGGQDITYDVDPPEYQPDEDDEWENVLRLTGFGYNHPDHGRKSLIEIFNEYEEELPDE